MSRQVHSADGSPIAVHSVGTGPGVVLLHGGAVRESDYRRLAQALSAGGLTVHRYNRRGRPDTAPITGGETVATDIEDLAAVLQVTGARAVFGHSGGGFIALQAGLHSLTAPLIDRIAVYDPGLCIDGRPNTAYIGDFERLIAEGNLGLAFALMHKHTYPEEPTAKLPLGVGAVLTRLFFHTSVGKSMIEVMPTIAPEVRRIADSDGPATAYAPIQAETLLMAGSRSPRYFAENCRDVAAVLPRGRALVVKGANHTAPILAGTAIVQALTGFFSAPRTSDLRKAA